MRDVAKDNVVAWVRPPRPAIHQYPHPVIKFLFINRLGD